MKEEENKQLGWDIKRNLAKINYRIHTDAIKENLIPPQLTPQQVNQVYANEADVLNVALFGMSAKQWRDANPGRIGARHQSYQVIGMYMYVLTRTQRP